MEPFNKRFRVTSQQKKEIERYLKIPIFSVEFAILKIIRKLKEMEQQLEDMKYGK